MKKLALDAVTTLTREQMMNVGGGGSGTGCLTNPCTLTSSMYTYNGHCGTDEGTCGCITAYGSYTPSSGVSHCAA